VTVRLVLPVKSLRTGKTRLSPVLTPAQRVQVVEALIVHVIEQAAVFPGLDNTWIVSACDEVRTLADKFGMRTLDEPKPGLNRALQSARCVVRASRDDRMLVVPCDLPLLTAEDLRCLADGASAGAMCIAPDRAGEGTNGLCLSADVDFEFAFGPGSYLKHCAIASNLQLDVVEVRRPGLAFDIDTPDDFLAMRQLVGRPDASRGTIGRTNMARAFPAVNG